MKQFAIGIDIGSTCAKAVVLDAEKRIIKRALLPTGWSSVDTAQKLKEQLSPWLPDAAVVATGYGRACVSFADRSVTEITCHGKGAAFLYGAVCLTGGLCELEYLRQALEKKLGRSVKTSPDGRYAGAIGAALSAEK